jgi:hypothetical protein
MVDKFTLIGIDGGATKVSGWIVRFAARENDFFLSPGHCERSYAELPGYISDFKPLPVTVQLQQRKENMISLTAGEIQQGCVYVEACARVIIELTQKVTSSPILVGIGMPGLKTEDQRGISVLANGPRMPHYAGQVEEKVKAAGIQFLAPISHLGSDADYCGIGEACARNGLFRDVNNAYYLGGGTGAADALLLHKRLVPFDQTKNWLAKTWEMNNDLGISMEKYVSASGLQSLYAQVVGSTVEELNRKKIYLLQIARQALKRDTASLHTFKQATRYLSLLLFERISTLYLGWQSMFQFVNPNHRPMITDHPYRRDVFNRVVIGQRLGELLKTEAGKKILLIPLRQNLCQLILNSPDLPRRIKEHYLARNRLRSKILVLSELREAPALGAGIDAWLTYKNRSR